MLQEVFLKEFPNHFADFLIVDRLIEQMNYETVTESVLNDKNSSYVFVIIQAKS